MKLRKLHIEDYKMFKDFDISFVDENDEALPIVVLAGVNGSGKTTLLEWINDAYNIIKTPHLFNDDIRDKDELIFEESKSILLGKFLKLNYTNAQIIEREDNKLKNEMEELRNKSLSTRITKRMVAPAKWHYTQNMEYYSTGSDNIDNIKEIIIQKYIDRAFEIDKPSEALTELQAYIKGIFDGLELTFNLSDVDYNKKEVLFKDNNGVEFDIDELSTGEKTLLSKVMYLYFKDYKDKVILIDEPELSLHPRWQNKILQIYKNFAERNECQIIIATHSPHIIGSAKNEYLRILRKNEKGNIEVVDNLMAYGRDIEWVLEEVMGTQYTRERKILEKIEACDTLINEEKYDEADNAIDALEAIIGEHDSAILTLRNSLAFERMDLEEDN